MTMGMDVDARPEILSRRLITFLPPSYILPQTAVFVSQDWGILGGAAPLRYCNYYIFRGP